MRKGTIILLVIAMFILEASFSYAVSTTYSEKGIKYCEVNDVCWTHLFATYWNGAEWAPIERNISDADISISGNQYDYGVEKGKYNAYFRSVHSDTKRKPAAMLFGDYAITLEPQDFLIFSPHKYSVNGRVGNRVQSNAVIMDDTVTYPSQYEEIGSSDGFANLTFKYLPTQLKEELVIWDQDYLQERFDDQCNPEDFDEVTLDFETVIRVYYSSDEDSNTLGVFYGSDRVKFKEFGMAANDEITTSEEIYFTDSNNETVYYVPVIYAYDSNLSAIKLNKTLSMTDFGNLKVTIHTLFSWLNDSSRVYPVNIDPPIAIQKDNFSFAGEPNTSTLLPENESIEYGDNYYKEQIGPHQYHVKINQRNIFEDGGWKRLEDARTLKQSDRYILNVDFDHDYYLEVKDYNANEVYVCFSKFEFDRRLTDIPVNIYIETKDGHEEIISTEVGPNLFAPSCYIFPLGLDKTLKYGLNSTEITIEDSDVEQDTDFCDSNYDYGFQIKFDISAIGVGSTIDDAYVSVYWVGDDEADGLTDTDSNVWRVDDQTWTELSTVSVLNSQTKDTLGTPTWSTLGFHQWGELTVTDQLQADVDDENTKFTVKITDPDAPVGTITSKYDNTELYIGGAGYYPYFWVASSREGTYTPTLDVTYTDPADAPLNMTILIPDNSSPPNVGDAQNVTITFLVLEDGVNITDGVWVENVTVGGQTATIITSTTTDECSGTADDCDTHSFETPCETAGCTWATGGCANDGGYITCSDADDSACCEDALCSWMSCPFLFTYNGTDWVREFEIISSSAWNFPLKTTYQTLKNPVCIDGELKVRIDESLRETSTIENIEMFEVSANGMAIMGYDEKIHILEEAKSPISCKVYGEDCLEFVKYDDDNSLDVAFDEKIISDEIYLEFNNRNKANELLLFIEGRKKNMVSDFYLYILSMVRNPFVYKQLSKTSFFRDLVTNLMDEAMPIIYVENEGVWERVGTFVNMGSNFEDDLGVMTIPTSNQEVVKIKISSANGAFLFDKISADTLGPYPFTEKKIDPLKITFNGEEVDTFKQFMVQGDKMGLDYPCSEGKQYILATKGSYIGIDDAFKLYDTPGNTLTNTIKIYNMFKDDKIRSSFNKIVGEQKLYESSCDKSPMPDKNPFEIIPSVYAQGCQYESAAACSRVSTEACCVQFDECAWDPDVCEDTPDSCGTFNDSSADCSTAGCDWYTGTNARWVNGTGWQVNVTLPSGLSDLQDLYIAINYSDKYANETETNAYQFSDAVDPVVTLNTPSADIIYSETNPTEVTFNCSATDNVEVSNITLYHDLGGLFQLNETVSASSIERTFNVSNGNWTWNCLAYDTSGNSDWAVNDSVALKVKYNLTIIYPTTANYHNYSESSDMSINFTYIKDDTGITDNVDVLNVTVGGEECSIIHSYESQGSLSCDGLSQSSCESCGQCAFTSAYCGGSPDACSTYDDDETTCGLADCTFTPEYCGGSPDACSTYTGDEVTCGLAACNFIGDYCDGTAETCDTWTNSTACGWDAGCSWDEANCYGTADVCGTFNESEANCGTAGCSFADQYCDGTAETCDTWTNETACGWDGGCTWDAGEYCYGTPSACSSWTNETACEWDGACTWSTGGSPVSDTEDFSASTDYATYQGVNSGWFYETADTTRCINDANDDCICCDENTNGENDLSKQSDLDMSGCSAGTGNVTIAKTWETGTLEPGDCIYIEFSDDSGSSFGDRDTIFCDDSPSYPITVSIPDAYLVSGFRTRFVGVQSSGGTAEVMCIDGITIACEGGDSCSGTPTGCGEFNSTETNCTIAGCTWGSGGAETDYTESSCGTDCSGGDTSYPSSPSCTDYMLVAGCAGAASCDGTDTVVDITLNGTTFLEGDSVGVTIDVMCYGTTDDYALWYYNGDSWNREDYDSTCAAQGARTKTASFTITSDESTQYVRAIASYYDLSSDDECYTGTYGDNDDVSFEVVTEAEPVYTCTGDADDCGTYNESQTNCERVSCDFTADICSGSPDSCDTHGTESPCTTVGCDWDTADCSGDADDCGTYNASQTNCERVTCDWNVDVCGGDPQSCDNYVSNVSAGSSGWCYQENSTDATDCGGLSTGTATCSGDWSASCELTYDGLWATYAASTGPGSSGQVYINYSKPTNALNTSLWQVKDASGTANFSIDSTCWDEEILQFKLYHGVDSVTTSCYNGSTFITVDAHDSGSEIYEEGMWWNLSGSISECSSFGCTDTADACSGDPQGCGNYTYGDDCTDYGCTDVDEVCADDGSCSGLSQGETTACSDASCTWADLGEQLAHIASGLWQLNVSLPSGFSGTQDLFLSANYTTDGAVYNDTTEDSVFYSAVIPDDVSFTIGYPAAGCSDGDGRTGEGTACTYCNYNFPTPDQTDYDCTGQNSSISFYVFTNTGNVNIDINWSLTSALDASLSLKFDSDSDPTGGTIVPAPPTSTQIVSDLATSGTEEIWLFGSVTSGIAGTNQYTINATSSQS